MSAFLTPPPWRPHPDDDLVIARNIAALDDEIQRSKGSRPVFTLDVPLQWHTDMHQGCQHVPVAHYVGRYRGDPSLTGHEVVYARDLPTPFEGSPSDEVAAHLAAFEGALQRDLLRLDERIPDPDAATPSRLNNVLDALAVHYATWIRIHPFVDGNGRTARLLANWFLARYWQPLILPGRPPSNKADLLIATAPALPSSAPDHRALVRHLRSRLMEARTAAARRPTGSR